MEAALRLGNVAPAEVRRVGSLDAGVLPYIPASDKTHASAAPGRTLHVVLSLSLEVLPIPYPHGTRTPTPPPTVRHCIRAAAALQSR